jgi:hypothetical protein
VSDERRVDSWLVEGRGFDIIVAVDGVGGLCRFVMLLAAVVGLVITAVEGVGGLYRRLLLAAVVGLAYGVLAEGGLYRLLLAAVIGLKSGRLKDGGLDRFMLPARVLGLARDPFGGLCLFPLALVPGRNPGIDGGRWPLEGKIWGCFCRCGGEYRLRIVSMFLRISSADLPRRWMS